MGSRRRVGFGQHFLERAWVERLLRLIDPGADAFLEIGPGRGALTYPLARAASRVLAIEIDRGLARTLASSAPPNLSVVEGDFLDVPPERITEWLAGPGSHSSPSGDRLRVVGNLPYSVASPILFKLIDLYRAGVAMADVTVMLQREVADRLTAPPGNRVYGVLSVLVRRTARVERLLTLPPGAFRPPPKVDSAVVRLHFHPDSPPGRSRAAFESLVQAVFTRRRKMLSNALLAYLPDAKATIHAALTRSGIDGGRRPESLEIAEFVRLADAFDGPRSA